MKEFSLSVFYHLTELNISGINEIIMGFLFTAAVFLHICNTVIIDIQCIVKETLTYFHIRKTLKRQIPHMLV